MILYPTLGLGSVQYLWIIKYDQSRWKLNFYIHYHLVIRLKHKLEFQFKYQLRDSIQWLLTLLWLVLARFSSRKYLGHDFVINLKFEWIYSISFICLFTFVIIFESPVIKDRPTYRNNNIVLPCVNLIFFNTIRNISTFILIELVTRI